MQGAGCIWARRMAWDPDCPRPAPVHPRRDPTTKLSTGQWSLQNQLCLWLPSQHSLLHSRDRAELLGGRRINESLSKLPGWLSHSVMLGVLGRELMNLFCCWGDLHLIWDAASRQDLSYCPTVPMLVQLSLVLASGTFRPCDLQMPCGFQLKSECSLHHIHLAEAGEWL